ncbi:DUF4837 family protein [uncultured Alistipes sp.]|uniref:DUF4837 family protein n=1 Tax=uncultured Alistipes sp. TaxID=538949 RepID=UPI0025E746E1|nr:DUF4837 family protein [uncultured Alistipes sp.]
MKKRLLLALVALAALAGTGCDAFHKLNNDHKKSAQGRPYELIVVCPQDKWTGELGDTLRSVLTAPVPYLNQTEPHFDVLRVTERGFSGMVADHRNILKVVTDPKLDSTTVAVQYDVTSRPQIVLTLQGPDNRHLTDYVSAHREQLLAVLGKAERDRAIESALRYNETGIQKAILKNFGVEMTVPKGYILAADQPDFLWARFEYPEASQGFFIYSYPYAGKEALTPEALIAARNQFAARIPGPSDGSYMTTSELFVPGYRIFKLEGRVWIEMRGFWDVEGDFMGGPYVSYTTVDERTGRVFTLDCYVYSPHLHKRNFMRGVEHLLYLVKFPD